MAVHFILRGENYMQATLIGVGVIIILVAISRSELGKNIAKVLVGLAVLVGIILLPFIAIWLLNVIAQ